MSSRKRLWLFKKLLTLESRSIFNFIPSLYAEFKKELVKNIKEMKKNPMLNFLLIGSSIGVDSFLHVEVIRLSRITGNEGDGVLVVSNPCHL